MRRKLIYAAIVVFCVVLASISSFAQESSFNETKEKAEHGNANEQNRLGIAYYAGIGVEQNYAEAFKWFCQAAEQGNANAQFNLGLSYYAGNGVEQNYAMAFKWLRKAAEQGNKKAQERLRKLGQN